MKLLICVIIGHKALKLPNGYTWFPFSFDLPGIRSNVSQCSRCGTLWVSTLEVRDTETVTVTEQDPPRRQTA